MMPALSIISIMTPKTASVHNKSRPKNSGIPGGPAPFIEPVERIELSSPVYKTGIIPLYDTGLVVIMYPQHRQTLLQRVQQPLHFFFQNLLLLRIQAGLVLPP